MYTEYKNLRYLVKEMRPLNSKQACWGEFMFKCDLKISFGIGTAGGKQDAIWWRQEYYAQGGKTLHVVEGIFCTGQVDMTRPLSESIVISVINPQTHDHHTQENTEVF